MATLAQVDFQPQHASDFRELAERGVASAILKLGQAAQRDPSELRQITLAQAKKPPPLADESSDSLAYHDHRKTLKETHIVALSVFNCPQNGLKTKCASKCAFNHNSGLFDRSQFRIEYFNALFVVMTGSPRCVRAAVGRPDPHHYDCNIIR
jgi:hypothetical protein